MSRFLPGPSLILAALIAHSAPAAAAPGLAELRERLEAFAPAPYRLLLGGERPLEATFGREADGYGLRLSGPVRLEASEVALALDVEGRLGADELVLRLAEPGRLHIGALRQGDLESLAPIELTVTEAEAPLLRLPRANGAWDAPEGALRLEPAPFRARYRMAEAEALALEGSTPRVVLDLRPDRVLATVEGGLLRLPEHAIVIGDLEATLAIDGDGVIDPVPVRIGRLRHEGDPSWFGGLALDGELRREEGLIRFDLALSDITGRVRLSMAGRQDLGTGRGHARVLLPPVGLGPGALAPGSLSPALAATLLALEGTVAVDGDVAWGPGWNLALLDVLLEDMSFTVGPARVVQVNGVIRLDRLWPPRTYPAQRLAIALLDLGLPLTDGVLAFELREDGLVEVEELVFRWAGGRVGAQPFSVRSGDASLYVVLEAEGLRLADLVRELQLDGLSGEGTMAGRLPLRLEGEVALIDRGELANVGPGWISYRPDALPEALRAGGEGVSLMLQALENFRYELLRITLDGRTDADMEIGLAVHGTNPELFGGHPVELAVNVTGELGTILRRSLEGYRLPDMVRERLERFGR